MMTLFNSSIDASDTWVLQEKVVYSFQPAHVVRRTTWPSQQRQRCSQSHAASTSPDVIILCLWPQATSDQIDYYVSGYNVLYPSARVILLHNNTCKLRPDELDYEEALEDMLGNRCEKGGRRLPAQTILLHLFGTSGAARACTLLRGYRLRTGGPLSVGAVVADTEPLPSLTTALRSSQPISSAFYSLILAFWIRLQQYMCTWPLDCEVGQIHQDLNNPSLLPAEARRCFILAHRGLMLTWMKSTCTFNASSKRNRGCGNVASLDVNDEAYERQEYALERGAIDGRRRWTGNQERYWLGIEGVWAGT